MESMDNLPTLSHQADWSEVQYHGGRPKFDFRTTSQECYKEFRKTCPEIKISSAEWRNIILDYNKMFKDYILDTGELLEIPESCGRLTINKKKRKKQSMSPDGTVRINLPIDWKKTKEKGKMVYNMNYHTDGNFFGWMWFRKSNKKYVRSKIKLSSIWYFKAMKDSRELLHKYLTSDPEHYHIYRQWKN